MHGLDECSVDDSDPQRLHLQCKHRLGRVERVDQACCGLIQQVRDFHPHVYHIGHGRAMIQGNRERKIRRVLKRVGICVSEGDQVVVLQCALCHSVLSGSR